MARYRGIQDEIQDERIENKEIVEQSMVFDGIMTNEGRRVACVDRPVQMAIGPAFQHTFQRDNEQNAHGNIDHAA